MSPEILQKIIADSRFLQGLTSPLEAVQEMPDIYAKIEVVAPIYAGNYDLTDTQLTQAIQATDFLGCCVRLQDLLILANKHAAVAALLTDANDYTFNEGIKSEYAAIVFEADMITTAIKYNSQPLFEYIMGILQKITKWIQLYLA